MSARDWQATRLAGQLRMRFSELVTPAVCGGNCGENTFELDVPFRVTVSEPTPEVSEPSTWMRLATALVLLSSPWLRIPSMLRDMRASS
jgi:hypothetical protein